MLFFIFWNVLTTFFGTIRMNISNIVQKKRKQKDCNPKKYLKYKVRKSCAAVWLCEKFTLPYVMYFGVAFNQNIDYLKFKKVFNSVFCCLKVILSNLIGKLYIDALIFSKTSCNLLLTMHIWSKSSFGSIRATGPRRYRKIRLTL